MVLFEVKKAGDAPLRISVPEPPFGAFELGKCMEIGRAHV